MSIFFYERALPLVCKSVILWCTAESYGGIVWATTPALSLNMIEYAEPSAFCTVELTHSSRGRGRISAGRSPHRQVLILYLSQMEAGYMKLL